MIEDAQTDTANINKAISLNRLRSLQLDTLANICLSSNTANNDDAKIYRLYRYGIVHPSFISPTERTIQQLKNAGGMRLIRKKTAVDSIVLYDDMAKKIADQQAYYELYQNESIKKAESLFNFRKFAFTSPGLKLTNILGKDTSLQLLTHDKVILTEFGNSIWIYRAVVSFYNIRLQEMKAHAIKLIETLKKEYHLGGE